MVSYTAYTPEKVGTHFGARVVDVINLIIDLLPRHPACRRSHYSAMRQFQKNIGRSGPRNLAQFHCRIHRIFSRWVRSGMVLGFGNIWVKSDSKGEL